MDDFSQGICPVCGSLLRMAAKEYDSRTFHLCPTPDRHPPIEEGATLIEIREFAVSRKKSGVAYQWEIPNLHFRINGRKFTAEIQDDPVQAPTPCLVPPVPGA